MNKVNMKLNRRSVLRGAAVAAVATPALVGKAIAAGEVTWRVQAHWPKASSSFTDSLGVVAAQLEEKTEGAFKLELLGAGEFAKGPDIYNIVRKGVVPMGTISPSYISDQAQAATFVYGIPGTLRQAWEMEHAMKNLGVEALVNEDLNADGVHLMLDYLAAAGAAPQYIPGSELYQSLSSGVVDGAHWGAAIGAQSMSLWEVCKYHYKPVLAQTTDAFIFNQDALEGLPEDLRNALVDTIEKRFFLRSAEYQHFEAIALAEGVANEGVEVVQLPEDVLEMLAAASAQILEAEGQKGERAAKAADIYRSLMKDMGYV
jgi:TRAP-type mannitol/chloroaromatic compound transport system substrate-binding protein